jgi:hypothetical protein
VGHVQQPGRTTGERENSLAFGGTRATLGILKAEDTLEFSDLVLTEWRLIPWCENVLSVWESG